MAKVLERSLYQTDYYAWTKEQAAALRAMAVARVNSTLDLENLAEEVESLGRSDLATVRSQLRRIIEHLLKLEHSPRRSRASAGGSSVIEARDHVEDVTDGDARPRDRSRPKASCSARPPGRRYGLAGTAKHDAAAVLPADCPYSFEQIVGQDWYPQNRHGLLDD